jgi:DNA-binding response OmpR family regulator
MPPPLLLVHDDLATIASVRRVLTRAGHSVHLATSTADALSAFEHLSPSAILLAPAVEGGRGTQLLAELRARAAGASTPVVLLGQPVEGMELALVPTPIEASALLEAVESALRGPDAEDLPLLDAGHMEELPPLVDAALAEAEADLEAEAFAGLPERRRPPEAAQEVAEAEALTHAAWEEADEARARAAAAESGRAEAEAARAMAEEALRSYQRAGAEERARRTEAEARVLAEAEEAKRLDAEARTARAQVEEARARAEEAHVALRAAQAQGTAEAELLAAALREEAARRTSELAVQERLRAEAEARAEREAQGRAEAEARAATEMARLAAEVRAREEAAARAQQAAEARAAEEVTRLAKEVQERDAAARRARAEAEDWAARERQALVHAERAQAQAQALEVEAAHLAERLAHGERAALEALGRAEEALRRERATGEALRGELAAARAHSAPSPEAVPTAEPLARPPPPEPSVVRRVGPRPSLESPAPWPGLGPASAATRLEWGAADGGQVSLEQLAALVLRLHEVQATARLELRAQETLRILWLAQGELAGAASTHPAESLLSQGVADGLLDEAAAAEARALRLPDEALAQELVERGALREAEVLPLLQRCTLARALEALSERDTTYRLAADASPPAGGCAPERPLLSVLAEALRRALPQEEVEARTHATRGVPRRLVRTALEPFGFAAGERRLLEAVDGERTALELLRRAGLRQDAGLRALAVAQALGLLDVLPPESPAPSEVAPEVELERLEKKWAAAEEADYFSVLGLPRTAGTEEVQRAHARLAAEFDPLRYAGHPDPEVPARATRLLTLLDEAAQALGDERLRQAYVRSLVDGEGGSRAN